MLKIDIMKNVILIFTAITALLFSCRPKDIDINVKPLDPKLVIFSQIVPDQLMLIMVTKSFSPLEGSMEDNMSKAEFSKLIASIVRIGQMFSETRNLKTGDTFSIDWIPNTGTVITIKGKPYGEPFKEPEFFNAMLRIWLGPNPADWKLKEALLSRPA